MSFVHPRRSAVLIPLTACFTLAGSIEASPPVVDLAVVRTEASKVATWHQWRGPDRDGQVGGAPWPARLSEGRLQLKWRVADLEDSYSGPIVSERMVFTTESRDGRECVHAYHRESGALAWSASWEGRMSVPFFAGKNGSWIRSTPAYDEGFLYVAGMLDVLVCLDAETGDVAWSADLSERFGAPRPAFGFVCSPLVIGDHVYVQAGAAFVKLDKKDGSTVWRSLEDDGGMMGSAFSSPILATVAGTSQLVVQTREYLAGVDPESGQRLWSQTIPAFRGMNILTPMVYQGAVFTAAYGGTTQLLTVRAADDQLVVTQAWQNRNQGNMTSPVIVGEYAYFLNRSNRFTCVDLRDGEIAWTSPPTGDDYWSLCARNDRILALSNTGRLRLINANPDAFTVEDECEVSEDETWAHLAVIPLEMREETHGASPGTARRHAATEVYIREQYALAAYNWR